MKERKEIQFEQPSEILISVNRYIILFLALIILGILGSGYWFFLKPKIANIHSFESQVSQTQERKMLNEALVLKIKELSAEYASIKTSRQDDLAALTKVIPSNPQIAELFVAADLLAQGRGFQLTSIEMSEKIETPTPIQSPPAATSEADGAATNPTSIATSTLAVSRTPIKSIVVHMTISKMEAAEISPTSKITNNAYDDFKGYLSDIEDNIRLADIQSVNFGELSGTGEGSTFSLDLLTYYK